MRKPLIAMIALMALMAAATASAAPVSEAASFYHQGRFDSAFTRLQALESSGDLKRRDSLSLYQYLGMASARLGREPEAEDYFATLLGLDSLFQFPRNEDPLVLAAFTQAQARAQAQDRPRAQGTAPQAPAPTPPDAPPVHTIAPRDDSSAMAAATVAAMPLLAATSGIELTGIGAAGAMGPAGFRGKDERQGPGNPPSIGLAMGSMPFGTGWFVRNKFKHGLVLGFLQVGGLALSMYASNMQTLEAGDDFRIQDQGELDDINRWKWIQRVSLSTAVGAYIFSLIASAGD